MDLLVAFTDFTDLERAEEAGPGVVERALRLRSLDAIVSEPATEAGAWKRAKGVGGPPRRRSAGHLQRMSSGTGRR
jgi:hypothetical protein